jgi:hypothetical protein
MKNSLKSGGSKANTTNRDSKLSGHGVATLLQNRGASSDAADKPYIQHNVKLSTVTENEIESGSPPRGRDAYIVKTPADFETYALQNLERNRYPPRPTFLRPPSEMDFEMHPSSPINDWHALSPDNKF